MKLDDGITQGIGQFFLALFGGCIGAMMRKEASTWQTALLGGIGAGFVGLLVAKFCHATGVSDDMTFVFVGVAGWLGAQRTIDFLERMIEEKLGVHIDRGADNADVTTPPLAAPDDTKEKS